MPHDWKATSITTVIGRGCTLLLSGVQEFAFVLPNVPLHDAMTQSDVLSSEEDSKCGSGRAFSVWWFMASKGSLPQTCVNW